MVMNNTNDAQTEFNRRLSDLQKEAKPSHIGLDLKEIVLYEKLLQIEEQLINLESQLNKS